MHNWLSGFKSRLAQNKDLVFAVTLLFIVDRLSKVFAIKYLMTGAWEPVSWFHLRYVENTGMAFGLMQDGNLLLIFIMLAVVAYLLKSWKELCQMGPLVRWALAFILAGALGNLYDRIVLGFVVDFFDFRVWPVFNVADSCITVGGCLLALALFIPRDRNKGEKK